MSPTVCPVNLEPRGRSARAWLGVGMLALSVVLLVILTTSEAPRSARLALFVPLFIGGLGLFQSLAGT